MIKEEKCVCLVCDGCGETFYAEEEGYSAFADEDQAIQYADRDGWMEIDGKHYCKKCYHYDGKSDEFVPNKKEE